VEVGRGGRGNGGGGVCSALGGFLRGGVGDWEGKVRKNFYPEFAQGRKTHQKGNLLERFALPGILKYTFLSRRVQLPKDFAKSS
jgi:hypothetical protein